MPRRRLPCRDDRAESFQDLRPHLVGQLARGDIGADQAGRDAIDADAVRAELTRHRLGETKHAGLRGRIVRAAKNSTAALGRDRRHAYDRSGLPCAHIVYGPPRAEGVEVIPLKEETVTPLCSPALAKTIRKPTDLLDQTRIRSDVKQIQWHQWFAANGLEAPALHGMRFDRSFLAIGTAAEGLGVALESTFWQNLN